MNIAPLVFVMVARHLVHKLCKCRFGRGMGCNVLHYVDDFLIVLRRDEQRQYVCRKIEKCVVELGFTLHPTKSDFVPKSVRQHLGLVVDLDACVFRVPTEKV